MVQHRGIVGVVELVFSRPGLNRTGDAVLKDRG